MKIKSNLSREIASVSKAIGQNIVGNWNARTYIDLDRNEKRKFAYMDLKHNLNGQKGSLFNLPNIYSKNKRIIGNVDWKNDTEHIRRPDKLFGKKVDRGYDPQHEPKYDYVKKDTKKIHLTFSEHPQSMKLRH